MADFSRLNSGAFDFVQKVDVGRCELMNYLADMADGYYEELWLVKPIPIGTPREVDKYIPLSKPDLHRAFARVGQSPEAIRKFCNKYGFLRSPQTWAYPYTWDAVNKKVVNRRREDKDWWDDPLYGSPVLVGEDLYTWQREIAEMGLLISLWDSSRREDAGALEKYLRWQRQPLSVIFCVPPSTSNNDEYIPTGLYRDRTGTLTNIGPEGLIFDSEALLGRQWEFGDVIEPVRVIVCQLINERLQHNTSIVVSTSRDRQIRFLPDSLLTALYILFALEVSGRTRPAILCGGCHIYFEPQHGRQQYHDANCRKRHHRRSMRSDSGE